jgi:hypothetical protein
MPSFSQYQLRNIVQDILNQLGLLVRLERKMLGIIASYAVAIGLFMLGVPISVQKLVSTFSFAVEPRMIFTLALMVAGALTGVAAFRILQARAVETAPATHLHQNCDRLHPNTAAPPRRIVSPPTCEPVSEANLLTRAWPWWRISLTLPWSVIFVSNDPSFTSYVDRRIILE